MKKVNGKNFKLIPITDKRCGKTPLSEYKIWETKDGDVEFGGVYYDRSKKGILSQVTEEIINDRKKFKKKMFIADAIENNRCLEEYDKKLIDEVKEEHETSSYYDSQQYVRKILANSIFGCSSNEYFHLYNYYNGVSITLGGQSLVRYLQECSNDYFKNYFHKNIKKFFPDFNGEFKQLQKDIVVQMDTDSLFYCLEEIIDNLGIEFKNDQEIFDWMNWFDKNIISSFIDKCLDIYAKKYDLKQIMNFKREKIITDKIVLAKKKYADRILANEDKLFIENPKISITGVEIVRTDTPIFCRQKLDEVVKYIFDTGVKDRKLIVDKLRNIKEEFEKSDIAKIAIPKGVSEYTKYAKSDSFYVNNGLTYPPHCPIHVRASMNYNYLVNKLNLPLMPITNGTKMKFVHVAPNNEIHQDVIGFINEWPKEFDDLFYIDTEEQWKKVFQNAIQRFFNVLGWGEIEIEENSLSDFIDF